MAKKNGENKPPESGDDGEKKAPEPELLPTKFVLRHGGHRITTLIGEVRQIIDGKTVIRHGLRAEFREVTFGTKLFVFDCEQSPAVKRVLDPVSPQQIAKLVMETRDFQRGLVITWEEYEDEQRLEAAKKAAIANVEKEFASARAAKRGKRGVKV
jgi:hypothetical protein